MAGRGGEFCKLFDSLLLRSGHMHVADCAYVAVGELQLSDDIITAFATSQRNHDNMFGGCFGPHTQPVFAAPSMNRAVCI